MIQNNPTNVSAAFEMLLEEVEAEIEFFNEIGKKAFEERNTAQWCRNRMMGEGLVARDLPHGTWEMIEKGRALLQGGGTL